MFDIIEVIREGAKTVWGIAGVSGSGKTFTAILLAFGIAKRKAKKVGFLDTENGRGKLYANILPGGEKFMYGHFPAPHSPARYAQAIRKFEDAGVEVLVIDSVSHEWEGVGGCEDIAHDGVPVGKPARWNLAKKEHKAFMNVLLQSSMHIIVCIRAREKTDFKNPAKPVSLGLQPICEKNFMFELTGSIMIHNAGENVESIKQAPPEVRENFGARNGFLGIEDGEKLRAWIDGAKPIDIEVNRERAKLANACENGAAALKAAWEAIPKGPIKTKLKDELAGLKESAEAYDKQRSIASQRQDETDGSAAVAAAIGGGDKDPADPPEEEDIYSQG